MLSINTKKCLISVITMSISYILSYTLPHAVKQLKKLSRNIRLCVNTLHHSKAQYVLHKICSEKGTFRAYFFTFLRKFRGNLCQDLCKPFLIATFSRSNSLFILISPPAKRHRFFGAFFCWWRNGSQAELHTAQRVRPREKKYQPA